MERAGRGWLAHSAPPPGWVRLRESGPSRTGWAGWSAPVLTTHLAPEPVAQAPASATAGPRGPSASGSGAPLTRCAPSRRGAVAGAPGLRGRTGAAGNSVLGGSGVSFGRSPAGYPSGSHLEREGVPGGVADSRARGGEGVRAAPRLRFRPPAGRAAAGTAGKHLAQGAHAAPRPRPLPPPSRIPSARAPPGWAVRGDADTVSPPPTAACASRPRTLPAETR